MKIKMQKEKSCFGMLLLTVAFLVLTPYPSLAQFLVEKIQNNGNDDNRMVWVIMGDGYTSPQLDDFHQNVDNIIDKIFSTSPWSGYKNFINVYRIDVISNEYITSNLHGLVNGDKIIFNTEIIERSSVLDKN
jgi:hypothetical protein